MSIVDEFKKICKVLVEQDNSTCEQYLTEHNIKVRNEDGSYKAMYDVLKECAEVWNKENDND